MAAPLLSARPHPRTTLPLLRTCWACQFSRAEMRILFDRFDLDGNGTISYDEFLTTLRVGSLTRHHRWLP